MAKKWKYKGNEKKIDKFRQEFWRQLDETEIDDETMRRMNRLLPNPAKEPKIKRKGAKLM